MTMLLRAAGSFPNILQFIMKQMRNGQRLRGRKQSLHALDLQKGVASVIPSHCSLCTRITLSIPEHCTHAPNQLPRATHASSKAETTLGRRREVK